MHKPVLVASITTAAAGVMSVLAAVWTATHWDAGVMQLDRSGATAVSVIAAMCWGNAAQMRRDDRMRREYRRREAAVIRSAAKAGVATTKPLPILREVGR